MFGRGRKRTKPEVVAIKNKNGLNPKQQEIQRKVLENTMEEAEIIDSFIANKITADQLNEKLVPVEIKRIESAIEAKKTGFKVEKLPEG